LAAGATETTWLHFTGFQIVLMRNKTTKASGSRTSIDLIRHFARAMSSTMAETDIDAVKNGEARSVRCYLAPESGEHRMQWKPGYLNVTAQRVIWRGSSRRWHDVELKAGTSFVSTRHVMRDEHVYKSWFVIECKLNNVTHSFAVPKLDARLCVDALKGNLLP
jgi:hypothetical protein